MSVFYEELKRLCPNLSEAQLKLSEAYFIEVLEKNRVMNLTRITGEQSAAQSHFYDSLAPLAEIPFGASVVDVGSGAGFPGVPLKIAREDISVTMLESAGKKADFIRETVQRLGISAAVESARAEEFAAKNREKFDCAVARAVADMRVLCELCLPLVKVGGVFLAYKGEVEAELEAAKPAIKELGGKTQKVLSFGEHNVVVIKKLEQTPSAYPRRYARIVKNPL